MAEEGKGVALAILGIVAVIAVVGLVLLFKGATGRMSEGGPGDAKLYTRESIISHSYGASEENPYAYRNYETWGGVSQDRYGKPGWSGAWDDGNVYGEDPYSMASETGVGAAPQILEYTTQAPTYRRSPSRIPSGQICSTGEVCPVNSFCEENPERARSFKHVEGTQDCYSGVYSSLD